MVDALSTATGASAAAAKSGETGGKNLVDYKMFLQLLVTQMKNQDPTQPTNSMDYVAQLANFSNVEQGVQTNGKLQSMMNMMSVSQGAALIGRTVQSPDGIAGVVTEVQLSAQGPVATLQNGSKILVGDGVRITA